MSAEVLHARPRPVSVIRYMGNKTGLAGRIARAVGALTRDGLVVDPMAGSHAVTQALKAAHPILCSDAQEYAAVIGRAFVANGTVSRAPAALVDELRELAVEAMSRRPAGYLERSFSDTWFGAAQCRQLDALLHAIEEALPGRDDPARALALCAVMAAACRGQASPGHFAQYLAPDHPRTGALRRIDLLEVALERLAAWEIEPGLPATVLALPWRELVEQHAHELRDATAWYLDPPYTSDQYSRFYHVLETIARGDEPELSAHKARYRTDRFASGFCSRPGASGELRDLLAAIRATSPRAGVVVSYSSRGLMSRETIVAAAVGWELMAFEAIPRAHSTQGKGMLAVDEWILTFVRI